jgi:hypothetical protein
MASFLELGLDICDKPFLGYGTGASPRGIWGRTAGRRLRLEMLIT